MRKFAPVPWRFPCHGFTFLDLKIKVVENHLIRTSRVRETGVFEFEKSLAAFGWLFHGFSSFELHEIGFTVLS